MRPSSRRQVAAWLLALPLGTGGEECARRGRLEMISFWLLCWKLLRATAGLRRTTPELTDGDLEDNTFNSNNPDNNPPTATQAAQPVTMETSSSPPLTDLGSQNLFSNNGLQGDEVLHSEDTEDECDYLVFEIGDEMGRARGGQDGGRGEIEGEDERRGEIEGEEEGRGETEGEDQRRSEKVIQDGESTEGKTEDWGKREVDGEDGGRGERNEEGGWISGPSSDLLFISDAPSHPPAAPLQEPWGHHLVSTEDLSDCLQAELALVYSDSDAGDDQWAAFASSDVSSPRRGSGGSSEERDNGEKSRLNKGEEQETKDEVQIVTREQTEVEDRRGGKEDDEEQMRARKDIFLRSPSVSSNASSSDPDRRLPVDFCVHQETSSENVSTEHVDFLLARQQWRKMEEEVKGQPTPKPGLRAQGNFQGTHTSLYPPARSPRLKKRESPATREPRISSTMSPSSEDSGLDDLSYRSQPEEPETAVEREIRLTLEREEQHRRDRGKISKGLTIPRPSTLQTGRSPPRPPACRTPTLSISPSPSYSSSLPLSSYHEMTANNVIILEPESSGSASRNRLISSAIGGLSTWPASQENAPPPNVIVVETSNLIIRSASEFCLSSAPLTVEPQESTFTSNPFFKLRSISSQSLVEQEIRMVRQREEEWRRQREEMWRRRREEEWRRGREQYDTVLVSPGLSDNISYSVPEVPDRSVSSPSSPSRTRKMERSSLSCDHKFPSSLSSVPRRQNTMAQRWEASLLANQKKE